MQQAIERLHKLTKSHFFKHWSIIFLHSIALETVSPEGTFCDTVQVPSNGGDMELI